jgi:hypothetical protein
MIGLKRKIEKSHVSAGLPYRSKKQVLDKNTARKIPVEGSSSNPIRAAF